VHPIHVGVVWEGESPRQKWRKERENVRAWRGHGQGEDREKMGVGGVHVESEVRLRAKGKENEKGPKCGVWEVARKKGKCSG
jgi:hypothetical protein